MSYQNNCIWTPDGSGSLARGEIGYGTSTRIEQKRAHQWLVDTSEQEHFFNKKQALESNKATSGAAIMNSSLWFGGSSSQSGGQMGDRLFSAKPVQRLSISDKNAVSVVSADMNIGKEGIEDQFGSDSSICLSMSQAVEDPLYMNTGLRKVKVNEVRTSDNGFPEFMGNSFFPAEKNKLMSTQFLGTTHNMFPAPTYSTADGNAILDATAFSKIDKSYISVGQASHNGSSSMILTNQYYDRIGDNVLSISQSNGGAYNIITAGEKYEKENVNVMSTGVTYSKGHENLLAVDPFYNKVNGMIMSAGSTYNKGDTDVASLNLIRNQQESTAVPVRSVYNNENSTILSMGQNCKSGGQTTISFGGFQDNSEESDPSDRLISSYGFLLNQSSAHSSGALRLNDAVEPLNVNVVPAATSKKDGTNKNKEQKAKKVSSNNFPSNVKSLLSTGIFDGVPVKYVSWSREKNLRGVVKGTAYLCGCPECKLSKAVNAYEFERHAGCKTKHPNNHIYFENGKTIYAVVQELKNTPQDMLFEVIPNATGSPINEKHFQTWKASFQAATRELQRIYGRDELVVTS